jgi:hypothetical protein
LYIETDIVVPLSWVERSAVGEDGETVPDA